MKSLYNKIYKAINEGVVKSLAIPDEQDNKPVNYHRSKVNNSIYSKEQFDEAADNFFNENPLEKYNRMVKYSMGGVHQYKIKDFQKLKDAFNKVSELTDNIDLSWADTTNALTFIMKNGNEVPLSDIDNVNNVILVKFNNIQDFYYPIIIHKNLLVSTQQKWSNINVDNGITDTKDGCDENTHNGTIIMDLNNYPAFEYCLNQSTDDYGGYLPAIDELEFLYTYKELINYILKCIKGKELNMDSDYQLSSTQAGVFSAWSYGYYGYSIDKHDSRMVVPFFRKIE